MNLMKKIFLLLLALTLVFALISCDDEPCVEHVDENEDLVCDKCDAKLEEEQKGDELLLIENGEAKFQIVVANSAGTIFKRDVQKFVDKLEELGITGIEIAEDSDKTVKDCEILIGDVSTRGDKYNFDEHTVGKEGYAITKIDNKIVISVGTTTLLTEVFEKFTTTVFDIENATADSLANILFTEENIIIEKQDNYRIPQITLDGNDIRGYTIAVDKKNTVYHNAAKQLQDVFYTRAGYWLEIVSLEEADKSFVIKNVAKFDEDGNPGEAGEDGFYCKGKNGQFLILCAYDNALPSLISTMVSKISIQTKAIEFSSSKAFMTQNISVVKYADYDTIKGDGRTNDFEAIQAVHEYANAGGQPVYAQSGKTYYIGETNGQSISVKTDFYMGSAKFIFDDQHINDNGVCPDKDAPIFIVEPTHERFTLKATNDTRGIFDRINAAGGIKTTDTTMPLDLGFDALVIPINSTKIMYKRWGADGTPDGSTAGGKPQQELFIVYKDNSIDEKTHALFDYEYVDSMIIQRIDDEPIVISGGTITTIATADNMTSGSVARNIAIYRSNVTLEGLTHIVENQPIGRESGGPNYTGFVSTIYANNVLVRNCKLSGRTHYNQGTYDIGGSYANNITYENVTQFMMYRNEDPAQGVWPETNVWGIMGTNYCKNLSYINCELSRFDAHAGVYNFTVKGCTIRDIKANGGGIAIIEDCNILGSQIISLRQDYASSWRGEIYVKNVKVTGDRATVIDGKYHNTDFGFNTAIPDYISVDNVIFENPGPANTLCVIDFEYPIYAIRDYDANGDPIKNKIQIGGRIEVKNMNGAAVIPNALDHIAKIYTEFVNRDLED